MFRYKSKYQKGLCTADTYSKVYRYERRPFVTEKHEMFFSDEGSTLLVTLDFTIHISGTPNFLHFDFKLLFFICQKIANCVKLRVVSLFVGYSRDDISLRFGRRRCVSRLAIYKTIKTFYKGAL